MRLSVSLALCTVLGSGLGSGATARAGVWQKRTALVSTRPAPAPKALPPPGRVHVLENALLGHLRPQTQANARSVVEYMGPKASGTGVVVGREAGKDGDRVLVLTANHVVRDNVNPQTALLFRDATMVREPRVVAHNAQLDYALVEVTVPHGADLSVARMERKNAPQLGEHVYGFGASTATNEFPMRGFIGGSDQVRARVLEQQRKGNDGAWTISSGHVFDAAKDSRVGAHHELTVSSTLPAAAGMSGGPVFDAASHVLVGIHVSGSRSAVLQSSGESASSLIVRDLAHQLARKQIDPSSTGLVRKLLTQ